MRVLIVEDDRKINEAMRRYLTEQSYAVDVAFDGKEGLETARCTPYDVIVLDLMLPLVDGFSVCRELRRLRVNTPVLMLTARDSIDDRVDGLDSGADDYLIKPFALRELSARLRALIRRQITRQPEITVADLLINTATHQVRRAGRKIELNGKEYAVLEYLALNKGRIVSRSLLEEHVWSYDFQPSSNIVDVYIARIRRRIDDDHAVKLLETVRGVGYRLQVPDETL